MKERTRILRMPQFFKPVCMAYKKMQKSFGRGRYIYVEEKYIREDILRLISKIKNTFGLRKEIPLPKIAVFGKSQEGARLPYAAYDTEVHTVIVNLTSDIRKDEEFLVIHELCHHVVLMMKAGKGRGFVYKQGEYWIGRMLDEGFTNFLAEQVYGKRVEIAYIFPTHVARQFSNILGKKYVNDLYLYSNIATLKKDFNKKLEMYYPCKKYQLKNDNGGVIEMTPFDIFCSCIEYIGVHWGSKNEKVASDLSIAIKCSNEMLDYYAVLSDTTNMKSYLDEQNYFLSRYVQR